MDSEALADAVEDDRRDGIVPVLIAATAGTTGGGMIDPLEECAAIARSNGIWYHVDAAWGGAALASERLRGTLAGIELADSLTIDAHKWFATTMGCGMFVSRDTAVLSEAFQVGGDFMPSNASNLDPYLNTVQWSRRFLGLRLFLALAVAGWRGYAAHVEHAVEVIDQVKERLTARGWSTLNDSPLAVLCSAPPASLGDVRGIVSRLLASGRAWVARTKFEGHEVVRICATHGETSLADVEELVSALNAR
jgi:glutamate/tyrosine decarboxylase-like PLP-dependent enzyme